MVYAANLAVDLLSALDLVRTSGKSFAVVFC